MLLLVTPRSSTRVLIAGGGIAAVEAMYALRSLTAERVSVELIAPDPLLRYRPAAPGAAVSGGEVPGFDLADLAARAGASFRCDAITAVKPRRKRVVLASGAKLGYDVLLLALGARSRPAIPGALTFRDQRDARHVRDTLALLRRGAIRRIAFAAPVGVAWTLPLYELALLTAQAIQDEALDGEVTLVTPERRALEVFGPAAHDPVAGALADRDVRLVCDARPRAVTTEGLALHYGGAIAADRVLAVPLLTGPELPGVPTDWGGFIVTDAHGRVPELDGVYAAGDLTAFPIKQGGLAAQQADAVAAAIAAEAGAVVPGARPPRVLRATLEGAHGPLYLRAVIEADGRPRDGASEISEELPWWPGGKVVGHHLSSALAAA
jgi:sulfide:quinone oxidoreductase